MNNFGQFNIKPEAKSFEGDKIKIDRIMNKQIIVEYFIIEASKYPEKGNGKRLKMQIIVDNAKRIVFTGSVTLQDMIQKVPEDAFPFTTTLIKENDRYLFT